MNHTAASQEAEVARFEALRAGDARAFERFVAEHLPGLRGFAGCYVPQHAVDDLTAHAVAAFLAGVDVFAWRCTLRSWLYGLLADAARGRPTAAPPDGPRVADPGPPSRLPGPPTWEDLPWGARWGDRAWSAAAGALDRLPLAVREAVWLRDVAGWPAQEAWDALACTGRRGEALLAEGRAAVRDALAALVGEPEPDAATRERQVGAAVALLADLAPPGGSAEVPPALRALFRRWRAARRRARLLELRRRARAAPFRAGSPNA